MSELFGYPNPSNQPMAELWMGAHPSASSAIVVNNERVQLNDWISAQPNTALGKSITERFNSRLPYLFKVLSAKTPLSIQSHPSKAQAEQGWQRENDLGIPLGDPKRSYKDDNHKPELVYALTEYHALNGFKLIPNIIEIFEGLNVASLHLWVDVLKNNQTESGLKQFYSHLLTLPSPGATLEEVLDACAQKVQSNEMSLDQHTAYTLALNLHQQYPYDIGIFGALILNYVVLQPGEAMFLKAGTLHAYLKGTALELMANSDNVLRGGLTPKYVDVKELIHTTIFEPLSCSELKITPTQLATGEALYQVPCDDFSLSIIELEHSNNEHQATYQYHSKSSDILFVIEGSVTIIDSKGKVLTLKCGDSVFLAANVSNCSIKGQSRLALASCSV
ncbi:mannose-6-phosphate isomerase, class I [Vibrio wakamikoensis]